MVTFRERNRKRLNRLHEDGNSDSKVSKIVGKEDCYSNGVYSKTLDFFIGFVIFIAFLFSPFLGFIVSPIACFFIYKYHFKPRKNVKFGMIVAAVIVYGGALLLFGFCMIAFSGL